MMEESFPDIALSLNPLNSQAREQMVLENLKNSNPENLNASKSILQNGIKFNPAIAGLRSLEGVIEEELGNEIVADKSYNAALYLEATDRLALLRRFSLEIEKKDFKSSVNTADIIFRRWDAYWSSIEPYLPLMLSDEEGFKQAADTFSVSPAIRDRLIAVLSNNPKTLFFAAQLMREWRARSEPLPWQLVNRVTNSMIRTDNSPAANLFFQTMLPAEMRQEAKFVFNGQFNLDLSGNLFDWQIKKQPGVSQTIINDTRKSGTTEKQSRYLEIKFLDSPVQYRGLSQIVSLAPGSYELSIDYSMDKLKTPKPIKANISCLKPRAFLAAIEFNSGSSKIENSRISFSVPRNECSLQELFFDSEFLTNSWRNRYSGTLAIHSVAIELVGG